MRFLICAGLAVLLLGRAGGEHKMAEDRRRSADGSQQLVLEKDQGEHRIRRPREKPVPANSFIMKFDRNNGGSQHLVLGTELIPPGGIIPLHHHLGQDEILLIRTSTAHIWLGDHESDVHAGAVVLIPSGTWIRLKNTGKEDLDLAFVFSGPGFDDYLRCTSVPEGQPATVMTNEEWRGCQHKGHAEFADT